MIHWAPSSSLDKPHVENVFVNNERSLIVPKPKYNDLIPGLTGTKWLLLNRLNGNLQVPVQEVRSSMWNSGAAIWYNPSIAQYLSSFQLACNWAYRLPCNLLLCWPWSWNSLAWFSYFRLNHSRWYPHYLVTDPVSTSLLSRTAIQCRSTQSRLGIINQIMDYRLCICWLQIKILLLTSQ